MPTLKQFTDGHVLGARLSVDWSLPADSLPAAVGDAVHDLEARLSSPEFEPEFDATERSGQTHLVGLRLDHLVDRPSLKQGRAASR